MGLPPNHGGGTVLLRAPGTLGLPDKPAGLTLTADGAERWALDLPANVERVDLSRKQETKD